jgi:hypothetical protein
MLPVERLFALYQDLRHDAAEARDFLLAKGAEIPPVLMRLATGDRVASLAAWAEAQAAVGRSLSSTAADPYLVTASVALGLACEQAVAVDATWMAIGFDGLYRQGPQAGVDDPGRLVDLAGRLRDLGPIASVGKPFLIWGIGDALYRARTPVDRQRSLAEIVHAAVDILRRQPALRPALAADQARSSSTIER